eukprot:3941768-Amphidinium_carterae.2
MAGLQQKTRMLNIIAEAPGKRASPGTTTSIQTLHYMMKRPIRIKTRFARRPNREASQWLASRPSVKICSSSNTD